METAYHVVYADVGNTEKVKHLQTGDKLIGPDIIPDHVMHAHNFPVENRRKLRPDALILEGKERGTKRKRDGSAQHRYLPKGARGNAFILEVGYTNETRYDDKLEEKIEEHETLMKLLEASEFTAVLCPIILGTTGGIFHSSQKALQELGVPRAALQKLDRKASFAQHH